ncbi:hypothetical protein [Limosilactobacillus reuteri]|nr:hypothetical protein [Limosilactobacillus reuteri]
MSTKKLNKFVDLSKKLVNFKDYSIEEQEEFVSNLSQFIAIIT